MDTKTFSPPSKSKRKGPGLSVKIRHDLAQTIHELAAQRQVQVEALVNEILAEHLITPPISDTEFLFSIGGMFNSEPSDTSEHVSDIVADYLVKKHEQSGR